MTVLIDILAWGIFFLVFTGIIYNAFTDPPKKVDSKPETINKQE